MFGDRLQELRLDAKLTQEELSTILKISRAALSRYENNENEPDLDLLTQISKYFKVSIDYLLGTTKMPTPQNTLYEIRNNLSFETSQKLNEILHNLKDEKYIHFVHSVISETKKLK